jgi:hypothetical protein
MIFGKDKVKAVWRPIRVPSLTRSCREAWCRSAVFRVRSPAAHLERQVIEAETDRIRRFGLEWRTQAGAPEANVATTKRRRTLMAR